MTYRKYYFTDKQWQTAKGKITDLSPDGEGEGYNDKVLAVHAWHPVKTEATYDEQGVVISEAVIDTKYCVDIIWAGEPLKTSFTSYEVWPLSPSHTIAGWEATYINDLYTLFPERMPVSDDGVSE